VSYLDVQIECSTGDSVNRDGGNGSQIFVVVDNEFLVVVEANDCGNMAESELNMCDLGDWGLKCMSQEFMKNVLVFGGGFNSECASGDAIIVRAAADRSWEHLKWWNKSFQVLTTVHYALIVLGGTIIKSDGIFRCYQSTMEGSAMSTSSHKE